MLVAAGGAAGVLAVALFAVLSVVRIAYAPWVMPPHPASRGCCVGRDAPAWRARPPGGGGCGLEASRAGALAPPAEPLCWCGEAPGTPPPPPPPPREC